jgi:hypothetical protein
MSNHILGNVDRHVTPAIMYRDRVSNHLRKDDAGPAPRSDDFLFAPLVHGLNPQEQLGLNVRAFFK